VNAYRVVLENSIKINDQAFSFGKSESQIRVLYVAQLKEIAQGYFLQLRVWEPLFETKLSAKMV